MSWKEWTRMGTIKKCAVQEKMLLRQSFRIPQTNQIPAVNFGWNCFDRPQAGIKEMFCF
jgi:hypothetical protein